MDYNELYIYNFNFNMKTYIKKLKKYLSEGARLFDSENYNDNKYCIHINYLVGDNKNNSEYLKIGLELFQKLIDIFNNKNSLNYLEASFLIYLKDSSKRKAYKPFLFKTIDDVLCDLNDTIPPELCLRDKRCITSNNTLYGELYKNDCINKIIFSKYIKAKNILVGYSAYRDKIDIENDISLYSRDIELIYNNNDNLKKKSYDK